MLRGVWHGVWRWILSRVWRGGLQKEEGRLGTAKLWFGLRVVGAGGEGNNHVRTTIV